ncbi:methylated-DNA--[protein]-cysteine S-methyltransferase [Propionibacteriaceae bacterium Y1923]|uniref:methylated-DNA--[protein]-cysteine S-methyltransferase n=1 Tax=Aestuariimicrobium sp. Y1814 TaxID=3418742 RepID=UPI003C186111
MTTLTFTTTDTPMGPFGWLTTDAGAVVASGWTTDPDYLRDLARSSATVVPGTDEPTSTAIADFFAGDPAALDRVPVQQQAGEFITDAWVALRRVPAGERVTYTELAAAAGRPAAVRAAASACATNRAALFVPCHRVVRSDGGLGRFRYGVETKQALLAFEATMRPHGD